ncbi:AraC family transcriptional regulator [Flagellimonas sp. HMM57]|uniref:AraC family transcriptional regulator n=1 Tax=unclassified Flagellimonas TaxID=2644544 RepID=UPI001F0A75C8|nr:MULTISPECIES: AraC family transcriptional regulator [unclassified Flagellimonas]UII76470.1 AraC family transcriptional regulator [Flagellimonas sp. HMM57]
MAHIFQKPHREIIQMSPKDSFLVFDRTKEFFDYPIHYHPEYELNFICNAPGVRRVVGDSMEEIADMDLVLIGPNLYHVWEQHTCESKKIREITIQFQDNLFQAEFLDRGIMKPIKEMFERANHGILFSRNTCLALESRIKKVSKLDSMDYFLEIFSILYDLSISRNQRMLSTTSVEPENYEHSEKLKRLHQFIEKKYDSKVSLSEVSDLLNMSTVSFNRFIKKRTGKTFVEYLNDIRIGYASRQLIEKDKSISEIAYSTGFNSIANFNRIFKKSKGCTPTKYREDFLGIKRVL